MGRGSERDAQALSHGCKESRGERERKRERTSAGRGKAQGRASPSEDKSCRETLQRVERLRRWGAVGKVLSVIRTKTGRCCRPRRSRRKMGSRAQVAAPNYGAGRVEVCFCTQPEENFFDAAHEDIRRTQVIPFFSIPQPTQLQRTAPQIRRTNHCDGRKARVWCSTMHGHPQGPLERNTRA